MATPRFLSAFNGFIPQATGQVISYLRDPKKFKLAKYVQYIQTPATVGVYARIHRDDSVRVVTDNDFTWADGADRPQGDWNQLRFEWVEFSVKRRNYPFRIGQIALEQAKSAWKPLEHHLGMVTQQCYINRTNRIMTLGQTASNWQTNGLDHAKDANVLNGGAGKWDTASDDPSSPHYNAIKKTLATAARTVNLDTNGMVEPGDLQLVISPETAQAMANSAEIHNYLKFGPFSREQLEGGSNPNAIWGLPPNLYGLADVIVDDTVYVSSRPLAAGTYTSTARQYAKDATSAMLLSRKGGINGVYGAPSFSTFQLYWYKWEAAVEVYDDQENKRLNGNIVDAFAEVLAAPESGMLLTNVL